MYGVCSYRFAYAYMLSTVLKYRVCGTSAGSGGRTALHYTARRCAARRKWPWTVPVHTRTARGMGGREHA